MSPPQASFCASSNYFRCLIHFVAGSRMGNLPESEMDLFYSETRCTFSLSLSRKRRSMLQGIIRSAASRHCQSMFSLTAQELSRRIVNKMPEGMQVEYTQ